MKKAYYGLAVISGVFVLLLPTTLFGAADPEHLWNEAVEKRTRGEKIAPKILKLTQEELDPSESVKSREFAVIRIAYDGDGRASLEVISSEKDGKDFTEQRRKRLSSTSARWAELKGDKTPFDGDLQNSVKRRPPVKETEGEISLLAFPFELPLEKVTLVGKARVTEAEGNPYDMKYTMDPLPAFVDYLDLAIQFKDLKGGGYSADKISYRFAASFLFFNWRGRGTLTFEDWEELAVKPKLAK